MAAVARFQGFVYTVKLFLVFILAFENVGLCHTIPSIEYLNIRDLSGNTIDNDHLSRTSYHVFKRSLVTPSVKKAFSSSEKKLPGKNLPPESSISLRTLEKSKYDNDTIPLNSTEVESSSVSTLTLSTKYNVTEPKTTAKAVNVSLPSSTTPLSTSVNVSPKAATTTTKATTTTTVFPDISATVKSSNISNITEDYHVYYNSSVILEDERAMAYWVNFDTLPSNKVVVHRMLSDSHRKAAIVSLSFDFPFYGHPLRNITIATGGFVYMGEHMHSWLAATQYVAPLMANFDTSLSNESTVRYFDNGTAFVIEWHAVTLQDETGGNFTFQTTLLKNGNIVFVYKDIPISITEIGDEVHPVKVGLSDAYVIDRLIYFIRRKTIYEYHRIDMKKGEIGNHTAIYFTALKICMSYRDCQSCMTAEIGLECVWCESAKRCSDGLDRLRQDWLQSKCDVEKHTVNCSLLPESDVNPFVQPLTDSPSKTYTVGPLHPKDDHDFYASTMYPNLHYDDGASSSARVADDSSSMGVGSVVAVLLLLAIVLGGLMWIGYAYKNPHTSSGQLLIRYRPTQWRLRSGEARYTAASVHM